MGEDKRLRKEGKARVTPEMIEAGLAHLYRYHPDRGVGDAETVTKIFQAMHRIFRDRSDPSGTTPALPRE